MSAIAATVMNTGWTGSRRRWPIIGYMPMPLGFRHIAVLRRGRPRHGTAGDLSTYDSFYIRHPPMECSRRAKIFAPFDALAGFSQCIASKQVLYAERRILTEGEREELDQKMSVLNQLTRNSRIARENQVAVSITYFEVCRDVHSEAYSDDGKMGQYKTVEGIVQKVDSVKRSIILTVRDAEPTVGEDTMNIPVEDIVDIHSEAFIDSCLESA